MYNNLVRTVCFLVLQCVTLLCLLSCVSIHPTQGPQPDDMWPEIRKNFTLSHHTDNKLVKANIKWYKKHPEYFNRLVKQAAPYIHHILVQTQSRQIPGELALLPAIESSFNPLAYSSAGASGLWQLMPGTASGLGIRQDWWYDGRRDVIESTRAALDYLVYLNNYFDDQWMFAIAAYDAGAGTVSNAISKNVKSDKKTDFWSLPLPRETMRYIPQLLALAAIIDKPEQYGIKLPPLQSSVQLVEVHVGTQIDLTQAAKLAGITTKMLHQFNPGFNQWAIPPDGPMTLQLPTELVEVFKERLAALPKAGRVTWQHHQVKDGDNLLTIARQYKTSVKHIKHFNKIDTNLIRVNQSLLIPVTPQLQTPNKPNTDATLFDFVKKQNYGPKQILHTVKEGQTLKTISKKYDIKIAAIRFWNQMKSNDKIQTGQILTLWKERTSKRRQGYYTVKKGDTLGHVALKNHIKMDRLLKQNHLVNSSIIIPGQQLRVS